MPSTIDVIIPTHGGREITSSCLRHLANQTFDHRVIVVDNASPDDSVERLQADFPAISMIALDQNRGFGAACNAGIAASRGAIVVLMNNDVDAEPTLLAELAAAFETDPQLGSVAPLLLRPDGRIDSVGLCADSTLAGFPRLQGRQASEAGSTRPLLLGPAGSVAAYRRAALDEVGLFDERLFMYQEDLDLALRLRAGGWGSCSAIQARAVHHGSATVGRRSASQRQLQAFARGYMLRAYGVGGARRAARTVVTELIVAGGDLVISRDGAAWRGRVAGWRAGHQTTRRHLPTEGIDSAIGVRDSLRLRRVDYSAAPPIGR
ncbi:MAG: glycosyltransferase family 2 protein [Solirubrobacterales bacterium]|nr:glycosyltransferase family 2 protein [Solirubrobacterales bacterium]